MTIRYRHVQRGALMLVTMLIAAAATASAGYFDPSPAARGFLLALSFLFVVLAWLFSSLTIDVTEDEIRWRFGPGLLRYRIARAEIVSACVVRNKWRYGFGIRMKAGFRLYNVSGLDAIELHLKAGNICRIGTDDPQGIAAALKS